MKSSLLPFLLLLTTPLLAAPERKLEEMRVELGDVAHQLRGQKTEIDLLTEQLGTLRTSLDSLKQERLSTQEGDQALEKERSSSLEKRVTALEKSSKTLVADLKTVREYVNTQALAMAKCEERLIALDRQLSSELKTLKTSLHSMLALMQAGKEESKCYTVQSGDSLGKIAVDHHTTIKALRELNGLTSDQIGIGQKLILNQ